VCIATGWKAKNVHTIQAGRRMPVVNGFICALELISWSCAPPQNVMDDFVCALKKRILLQGRMYVFEHYVCFHSNVLGYVKNKIIPLKVLPMHATLAVGATVSCSLQVPNGLQLTSRSLHNDGKPSQWRLHSRDGAGSSKRKPPRSQCSDRRLRHTPMLPGRFV